MAKIYNRIQEKTKEEVQSQQTNYQIHKELVILTAFVTFHLNYFNFFAENYKERSSF